MSILVNERLLNSQGTGIPKYIKSLYSSIANIDPKIKVESISTPLSNLSLFSRIKANPVYFDMIGVNKDILKLSPQFYHSPSCVLPLKKIANTKYIVTIHDLAYKNLPDHYSRKYAAYFDFAIKHSLQNADYIICDSFSCATDLSKYFKPDQDKIHVNYLGVEMINPEEYRINSLNTVPYLFTVATHPTRKNLFRALEAFKLSSIDALFYIAGSLDNEAMRHLDIEIRKLDLHERVKFLGYVDKCVLKSLYANCKVFIYPSLYEGFGLPIIEAGACGAYVISSNTSSMIEVNPWSCNQFDPYDVDDIARSIRYAYNLTDSEHKAHTTIFKEFCNGFSWDSTASKFLQIIGLK